MLVQRAVDQPENIVNDSLRFADRPPSRINLFGIHAQHREQKRELVVLARGLKLPRQLGIDELLKVASVHRRISIPAAGDGSAVAGHFPRVSYQQARSSGRQDRSTCRRRNLAVEV